LRNVGREPYSHEKFNSNQIGPNMYQVNEQVIMPVTADRDLDIPGASWSLMTNPVGSRCTLFVTHAWAEGVFEFEKAMF